MAVQRIQFHQSTDGSLNENEDWWTLLVDGDAFSVEHKWHHMNPYKSTVTSEGTKVYSLQEFREMQDGKSLAGKLDAAIQKTIRRV